MNRQNKKTYEFGLSDVAWKILSQWKAILLFSLAIALAVCVFNHNQAVNAYKAEKKAMREAEKLAELTLDERIEKELSKLSDADRGLIEYVVSEQDWIDEQTDYLNESLAMNSSPTSQRTLKIIFDINTEEITDHAALLDSYKIYAYSDDVISAIKPFISADSEDKYIGELLSANYFTAGGDANGAIEVKILLPQDTDADAVTSAVEKAFKTYSKQLNSSIQHEISLTERRLAYEYHLENVNKRIAVFNHINSLKNNIKTASETMTPQQIEVLNAINTAKLEAKKANAGEGDNATKASRPKKPGYSVEYALLGFVLGIIVYAFAYLGLVLIRARVFSAGDLEYFTRTRTLGEVYYEKNPKGLQVLTHSRFIERLHHKSKLDIAKQIGIIADSTKGICEHIGKGKATFINLSDEGTADETINSIIESAGAKNLSFDTVKIESAADEGKLSKVEDAILIVPEGIKASELWNIDTLCNSYDVNRLGCVWVGEI